jgi:glycosyltransferase involved in cell wall biosynthesis
MMRHIAITIVIPTHNRVAALMRLLRSLERQLPVPGGFEVIVVSDGSTDCTAAAVSEARWSFPIVLHEQAPSGPAVARNAGAARAVGEILLFLDDDVEPMPEVVRAHAMLHSGSKNSVAIGDLQPVVSGSGYFGTIVRGWWHTMNEGPRQRGHRYHYRDLLTGHFSIPRRSFEELGGFNPLLRSHEDWELGYRAIAAGMNFQFLPDAVVIHHETATLSKTLNRKRHDGAADVQLLEWYPELISDLPVGRPPIRSRLARSLRRLAWARPVTGDCVVQALRGLLRICEIARFRFLWRRVLEKLVYYSYWRGVAKAAGDPDRLRALLDRAPRPQVPDVSIDLGDGIEAAKTRVDAMRPASARLMFAGAFIGDVDESGAERLRGEHLPKLVVERFALEYTRAASQAGAVPWNLVPQTARGVAER